jgi:hypothetical protein
VEKIKEKYTKILKKKLNCSVIRIYLFNAHQAIYLRINNELSNIGEITIYKDPALISYSVVLLEWRRNALDMVLTEMLNEVADHYDIIVSNKGTFKSVKEFLKAQKYDSK